jgi:hypothetical protein
MSRQATRHHDRPSGSPQAPPIASIAPYLSAEQLAVVTPWTPDAIEKMISRGLLIRGVHFFQPFGRRSQRIFKWASIQALIEGGITPSDLQRVIHDSAIRGSAQRVGQIDVEKATAELQRLLG